MRAKNLVLSREWRWARPSSLARKKQAVAGFRSRSLRSPTAEPLPSARRTRVANPSTRLNRTFTMRSWVRIPTDRGRRAHPGRARGRPHHQREPTPWPIYSRSVACTLRSIRCGFHTRFAGRDGMNAKSAGSSDFGLIGSMVEAGRYRVETASAFGGDRLHLRRRTSRKNVRPVSPWSHSHCSQSRLG